MSEPATVDVHRFITQITSPAERTEVIRTGEREPISEAVRNLQLDHILPWSAGGSDKSFNLRTMCAHCNEARSNYFSLLDEPAPPVVPNCFTCTDDDEMRPEMRVFCIECRKPSIGAIGWAI